MRARPSGCKEGRPGPAPTLAAQVADEFDENWPLRCICNLCSCGGHRCSNFSWNEQLAAELEQRVARPDGRQPDGEGAAQLNGHQCHRQGPCERYLTSGGPGGGQVGGRKWADRTNDVNNDGAAGSSVSFARATGGGGSDGDGGDGRVNELHPAPADDELLHVLVTRPEIAGRPRDNIIFEGDMDLKTTFETSYEALARMRLEHWRRHQEAAGARPAASQGGQQSVSSVEQAERRQQQQQQRGRRLINRTAPMPPSAGARSLQRQMQGRQAARRARQAGSPAEQRDHSAEPGGGDDDDVTGDNDEGGDWLAEPMETRRPATGETVASANQQMGTGGRGKVARSPAPASPTKQLVMSSPISRVRSPAPAELAHERPTAPRPATTTISAGKQQVQREAAGVASNKRVINNKHEQSGEQPINSTDAAGTTPTSIDPDLAPIICYDANMNRLERVGLRRRSKYRPSTSLRPGARGFFGGGGNEDELGHEAEQVKQQAGEQGASREPEKGFAGATTKELDRADDANISGRRHLLDHSGRRDHIKEQEVAEQRGVGGLRRFEDKSTLTEASRQSVELAASGQMALERRLAEEEESAVIAEIQRCTREAPEGAARGPPVADSVTPEPAAARSQIGRQQQRSSTPVSPANQAAATERSLASSRQSRQQRVCQNQSFYLNENEYPMARGALGDECCIKIGGRGPAQAPARANSQQGRNSSSPFNNQRAERAKNLFRESPDFILTTGQARARASSKLSNGLATPVEEEQQDSAAVSDHARGRFSREAGAISENAECAMDSRQNGANEGLVGVECGEGASPRPPPSSTCRVLNLDNRYEFVGFRSGHKYFVERDLNVRELESEAA